MLAIKSANLALRFLLEICALVALGYWGFKVGKGPLTKGLLGIGTPLVTATVWAMYGAPAAKYLLHGWAHTALELGIFAAAILALYSAGRSTAATSLLIVVVINRVLMTVWGQ